MYPEAKGKTISPFVGCKHDCVYCLAEGTLILTADLIWKPIEEIMIGEKIVGFDEFGHRHLKKGTVIGKQKHPSKLMKINTEKGSVECSPVHPWLVGSRWVLTRKLKEGDAIRWLSKPTSETFDMNHEYREGYLAGAIKADGFIRKRPESTRFRLAVRNEEFLATVYAYLLREEISCRLKWVNLGRTGKCLAVVTSKSESIDKITKIVDLKAGRPIGFMRGFLAGIFDGEGSYSRGVFRIVNADEEIIRFTQLCLEELGFDYVLEEWKDRPFTLRLKGGLPEVIRFFSTTYPRIAHKKDIFDTSFRVKSPRITSIEVIKYGTTFDLTTSTATLIANGFASHNCDLSFKRQMRRRKKYCLDCYHYTPHAHLERIVRLDGKWVPPPRTKPGEFIFLCDFADVTFAPREVMELIIGWMRHYSDRTFLLQSKNPECFHPYSFPENVILGVTIETDKVYFNTPSRYTSYNQISRAPLTIRRFVDMLSVKHPRKLVIIEPILDFNLETLVAWIKAIKPEAVYMGYDSHGKANKLPEPPLKKFDQLKAELEKITEVRVKLRRKAWYE